MMLRGAEEARRVLRLLFGVPALLSAAFLGFTLLPSPYSEYAWVAAVTAAGFL